MYFSQYNGIVPIPNAAGQTADALKAALAAEGYGQVKKGVQSEARETYTTNVLATTVMFKKASIGAGVVSSTISDLFPLPGRVKIPKIAIACTGISATDGSITANIVVGTGAYETGAVAATNGAVWTGAPNHDGTVTVTVAGHAVVYTEVGGDTTPTILMGHVAAAVNADGTVGPLVTATNVAGHLILTWNEQGTAGNGQTLSVSTTDTFGGTFVRDAATFTGGAAATGIVLPQNDNSSQFGFCSNPAPAGAALFSQDIPFNTTVFPGLTTGAGGASAPLGLIPTYPDAVFSPANGPLTLRLTTAADVGSITNLVVTAYMEIQPLSATFPSQNQSPALNIPFPGVDM